MKPLLTPIFFLCCACSATPSIHGTGGSPARAGAECCTPGCCDGDPSCCTPGCCSAPAPAKPASAPTACCEPAACCPETIARAAR
ncbi:MAG: hypothetical protein IPJ77_08325 [Planctomycetes bacterium]|nr:hypothetical protein [Planctomycetota bacterium]